MIARWSDTPSTDPQVPVRLDRAAGRANKQQVVHGFDAILGTRTDRVFRLNSSVVGPAAPRSARTVPCGSTRLRDALGGKLCLKKFEFQEGFPASPAANTVPAGKGKKSRSECVNRRVPGSARLPGPFQHHFVSPSAYLLEPRQVTLTSRHGRHCTVMTVPSDERSAGWELIPLSRPMNVDASTMAVSSVKGLGDGAVQHG